MAPLSLSVLYVDDDENNRDIFLHTFSSRFSIVTCSSGAEALRHVANAPPAVIVTDQRMPSMTGIELLERVREVSPATRRLMLTAYDDGEIRQHNGGGVCGCIEHHFMKPFDAVEIAAAISLHVLDHAEQLTRTTVSAFEAIFAADEQRRRETEQLRGIATS